MNAPAATHPPVAIGTPLDGGFFIGSILLPDGPYGLVKAPKALGEFTGVEWGPMRKNVPGALSLVDGLANTKAMAEAGSKLAKRILDLQIDGQGDWYLPALDELEVIYRAAKPTADENSLYMRSGINLHAIPPTLPYTVMDPALTAVEIFRAGGAEAFEPEEYWTSTPCAHGSSHAWCQWFYDGLQDYWGKDDKCRACAVRRFKI